jgi:hypothetical protein
VWLRVDDLAMKIAEQLGREVHGARSLGALHTGIGGRPGRRPGIEASVSFGVTRPGIVAFDGKDSLSTAHVLKIAEDCHLARALHPEAYWIQPVLVLPAGCDVRSDAVLLEALRKRVMIATTVLSTRPLGLSSVR